ncbi:NUDIX hydrolase [Bacteroidota bacterium]
MIELAGCRILKEGKTLLLHRKEHEHWELPGGAIEEGDGMRETAIREASEEIGCEVKIKEYLGYTDFEIKGMGMRSHQFSAEIVKGEPKINEPELFDGIEYIDLKGDKNLAPNIVKEEELIK